MNRDTLRYLKYLEERIASITDAMTSGAPQNYEAYQRLLGQHEGFTQALTKLNEILKTDDEE